MINKKQTLPEVGKKYTAWLTGDFEVVRISNNNITVKHDNGQHQTIPKGVLTFKELPEQEHECINFEGNEKSCIDCGKSLYDNRLSKEAQEALGELKEHLDLKVKPYTNSNHVYHEMYIKTENLVAALEKKQLKESRKEGLKEIHKNIADGKVFLPKEPEFLTVDWGLEEKQEQELKEKFERTIYGADFGRESEGATFKAILIKDKEGNFEIKDIKYSEPSSEPSKQEKSIRESFERYITHKCRGDTLGLNNEELIAHLSNYIMGALEERITELESK